MATEKNVHEVITMLSILPNCPITVDARGQSNVGQVVKTWHAILKDLPNEYLQASCLNYLTRDNPFFPANPGVLREIAYDLEMQANGLPSPSEAWAKVLSGGPRYIPAVYCEIASSLHDEYAAKQTRATIDAFDAHQQTCTICKPSMKAEDYGHPVINMTVAEAGGRSALFTDNRASDRTRFQDAYIALVARERSKMQMIPEVQKLVADPDRPQLVPAVRSQMNVLAKRLGQGGD